jgi:hypothetical protein
MRGVHTSTPPFLFMAWCLIKYRDGFIFSPLQSSHQLIYSSLSVSRARPCGLLHLHSLSLCLLPVFNWIVHVCFGVSFHPLLRMFLPVLVIFWSTLHVSVAAWLVPYFCLPVTVQWAKGSRSWSYAWDLRFSRLSLWKLPPSEMWRHIIW